jgi:regulatory protein
MQRQQEADPKTKAKNRALRLLSYRARSTYEIKSRLKRAGFAAEIIDQVVGELQEAGLLDDTEFAREWVQWRTQGKPRARRIIAAELRRFGVTREIVEEAIASLDDEAELQAAVRLAGARSRRLRDEDENQRRRKLAAYLAGKGYGWEIVSAAVRRVLGGED